MSFAGRISERTGQHRFRWKHRALTGAPRNVRFITERGFISNGALSRGHNRTAWAVREGEPAMNGAVRKRTMSCATSGCELLRVVNSCETVAIAPGGRAGIFGDFACIIRGLGNAATEAGAAMDRARTVARIQTARGDKSLSLGRHRRGNSRAGTDAQYDCASGRPGGATGRTGLLAGRVPIVWRVQARTRIGHCAASVTPGRKSSGTDWP